MGGTKEQPGFGAGPAALRWLLAASALAVLAVASFIAVRTLISVRATEQALEPGMTEAQARIALADAIAARPDLAEAHRLFAASLSFDQPQAALREARASVSLDPQNWQTWRELGLVEFRLGDAAAASRALDEAVVHDRGFDAHFESANLALLLGRTATFWRQMRAAMTVAQPADVGFILNRYLATPMPEEEERETRLRVLLEGAPPLAAAQSIEYLLDYHHIRLADAAGQMLNCPAYDAAACGRIIGELTTALAEAGYRAGAPLSAEFGARDESTWNRAVRAGMLPWADVRVGECMDGGFQHPWDDSAFSWRSDDGSDVEAQQGQESGPGRVRIRLTGRQPDRTALFHTFVLVKPSQTYAIDYSSRGSGGAQARGITLEVSAAPGSVLRGVAAELQSAWTINSGSFRTPPGVSLVRLSFIYQRLLGQMPLAGTFEIEKVRLTAGAVAPDLRGGAR